MLRSCYCTTMVFGTDHKVRAGVQWYWADEDAEDLGVPTPFVSRNYLEHGDWPDIGEVEYAPRPWRNGSFPVPVPGDSPYCGQPAVWAEGWPGPVPKALNRQDSGLAWCCGGFPAELGQPILDFWPAAYIGRKVLTYVTGAIANRPHTYHDIIAAVSVRHTISTQLTGSVSHGQTVSHQVKGYVLQRGAVTHQLDGAVGARHTVTHQLDGAVGARHTVTHQLDGAVGARHTVTHQLDGAVGARHTVTHQLDGTVAASRIKQYRIDGCVAVSRSTTHGLAGAVCPPSGVLVEAGGSYTWTAPPGVTEITLFAWSAGGDGGWAFPAGPVNSGGGGGGGFAAKWNAAVTPGHTYSLTVPTTSTDPSLTFAWDTGSIVVTCGSIAASGGAGGSGSGGDLNYTGGAGGIGYPTVAVGFMGAGGGQAASVEGNGSSGSDATPSSPGIGGGPPKGFGSGGNGGNNNGSRIGTIGSFPGGGGGGVCPDTTGGFLAPGSGQAIICWSATVHFIVSTIVRAGSATHQLTGEIAGKKTATHQLDSTVAAKKTTTHQLKGALAAKKSDTHQLTGDVWNNVLFDNFIVGSSTPINGKLLTSGQTWAVTALFGAVGDLVDGGNNATLSNATSRSFVWATTNAASANHTAQIQFDIGSASGGWVIVFARYQDANNYLAVHYDWKDNDYQIYQVVAGVATTLQTGTFQSLSTGTIYTLSITTTATTVSATISGGSLTTTTIGPVSNSNLATQLGFGFGMQRWESSGISYCHVYQFRVY